MKDLELIAELTREHTLMKYFTLYFVGVVRKKEPFKILETGVKELDFLAECLNDLIEENEKLRALSEQRMQVIKNMNLSKDE